MSVSKNRYRTFVILMIVGIQLTLLGLLGLIAEVEGLLAFMYVGPILTFGIASYALFDLSSSSESSQYN